MSGSAEPGLRYRNRLPRLVGVSFFVFVTALSIGQLMATGMRREARLWFIGVALLSALLAYRAFRSYALDADLAGVRVTTFLRSQYLEWKEVNCFETDTRFVGTWRRTFLVAVLRDGSRREFTREINARPSRPGRPSPVQHLAGELNALAEQHRW